jgi:radical SAM protein with 4Fe4S-binding SPASM domain
MKCALRELTLELTQRCFQNCLYCSSSSYSDSNVHLSIERVKDVLNDFYYLGGKVVELSGGEPLAYDGIYETVEYASRIGLQIHLFTCAHFPEKEIDLDKLEKVDRFYVNLQAPTKAIHDHLTKTTGSFDQVLTLIKALKARGKWVGTHLIPLSLNIDEIDEYIHLAKLLKIDNVSLLRFVEQGRGKKNSLVLNYDEVMELFSKIEKYRQSATPEFKVGCPLDFGFIFKRGRGAIACKSGLSRCVIRPNGNVVPCPAFKDSDDFVLGNVNTDSLVNIWNTSPILKKIRSSCDKRIIPVCSECSFWEICKGRCPAQRLHHYGDSEAGPDPYCPLKRHSDT